MKMQQDDNDNVNMQQRAEFMRLLRAGVAAQLQQKKGDSTKMQAWHALPWRNAYALAPHFEEDVRHDHLRVRQIQQGEVHGLGTGLTVWPAAVVLLKHLEQRSMLGAEIPTMQDQVVVELGSGTGVVGIAAALLGAQRVVVTDMPELQFLMQENVDLARTTANRTELPVEVASYAWGTTPPPELTPAPDWLLVSDCVLPKLYPIQPLVDALHQLADAHTRVLISYEHRYYEHFDAKEMFWNCMSTAGFTIQEIDSALYHPQYRTDDIEIWEAKLDTTNTGHSNTETSS